MTTLSNGPWSRYSGEDTNGWWIIVDADGNELGSCDGGFEAPDACLMSASYEMLEGLKYLRRCANLSNFDLEYIDAIISKAEEWKKS